MKTETRRASLPKVNGNKQIEAAKDPSVPNNNNMAATFTYQELAAATCDFAPECLLGRGGFGAVYKGTLESTGQVVAVKQLDQSGIQGDKEFLVEVLMLSLMHHPNLVNLIGFCAEGEQRLLVYEYMPFGSLEDRLFDLPPDETPLDWNTRLKIALGAAKGLESLHKSNPPVIYRDLKASNILLDESFEPKLSDFGLAKFGPIGDKSHVSTRVMGTYGYCAPEYASTGRLTIKTDIYSYGIVLLELITGRRALEEVNGRSKHLVYWAMPLMKDQSNFSKLVDPLLKGNYSMSTLKKVIEVAGLCLHEDVTMRPVSSDLVAAMQFFVSRKREKNSDKDTSFKWSEIGMSPNQTSVISDKDSDRDRAVAEAKMWGESWRDKRMQSPQHVSEGNDRYQN
ncbi:hypothetical protein Tsubulata_015147 [Turnera subulata]|uniref:Protein kinase domain-containing protein n=1 Tax=Turnera subulata TaxID=218843 RepID=A0A9Q0IZZ5_9ROSI|nr:hypothetical protein Tsubulata_015147 [Turnera subulata]